MAHYLIVGKNTYATAAEALAYLESRHRTRTAWAALAAAEQLAALSSAFYLIETMWSWLGSKTGVTQLATVTKVAGGSGYVAGEIVTLVGGTGEAAQVEVLTVSSGAVATYRLIKTGYYTTAPSGTLSTTASLAGTGATFSFASYTVQQTDWPRTGTAVDVVEDDEVPADVKNAQSALAYEITQDPDLETALNANLNTRRQKVGSLEVEYFRPEARGRFPAIVQQLLAQFIGDDEAGGAPQAFGTDGESTFSEENPYGFSRAI